MQKQSAAVIIVTNNDSIRQLWFVRIICWWCIMPDCLKIPQRMTWMSNIDAVWPFSEHIHNIKYNFNFIVFSYECFQERNKIVHSKINPSHWKTLYCIFQNIHSIILINKQLNDWLNLFDSQKNNVCFMRKLLKFTGFQLLESKLCAFIFIFFQMKRIIVLSHECLSLAFSIVC